MTPNALKQGKFDSLGAIFLFIFLPCMWGLGLQKESPLISEICNFQCLEHGPTEITYLALGGINYPQSAQKIT